MNSVNESRPSTVGMGTKLPYTRAAAMGSSSKQIRVIAPPNWLSFGTEDLWNHRAVVWVLVWRDLKARYKQTILGAVWAVIQPLATMVVFTFVFARLAKVSSNGYPYPLFVLSGLLPWQFFSQGIVRASNSLVQERYLLTRIFIPRLALPISAILGGVVDLGIGCCALAILMTAYGLKIRPAVLAIIPFSLLGIALALSVGSFLAALNVRFRDVGYTVPFLVQLWFFITPIAYPSSLVPSRWHGLYALNPMNGVIEGFRWAVLGHSGIESVFMMMSITELPVLPGLALFVFHQMERSFADVV